MAEKKESGLLKKLKNLKDSQDAIQGLSSWCLVKGGEKAPKIISTWLKAFREVSNPRQRISLVYLANDIIQNAKRKKIKPYVDGWKDALTYAVPLIGDEEKAKGKVARVLKILEERNIFEKKFIASLLAMLEKGAPSEASSENGYDDAFQLSELSDQWSKMERLKAETKEAKEKLDAIGLTKDKIKETSKKIREFKVGDERAAEFDESVNVLRSYCASLKKEKDESSKLISVATHALSYYTSQGKDAKTVFTAYKNFGDRVKMLSERLEEKMEFLQEPSPVPSPDMDAPSPEDRGSDDDVVVEEEIIMKGIPKTNSNPGVSFKIPVSSTSSSFLNMGNSLQKLLENAKSNLAEKKAKENSDGKDSSGNSRGQSREKERDKDKSSRHRSRSRSRERHSKSKDRDRERGRSKSRSRSRDRGKNRSRSKNDSHSSKRHKSKKRKSGRKDRSRSRSQSPSPPLSSKEPPPPLPPPQDIPLPPSPKAGQQDFAPKPAVDPFNFYGTRNSDLVPPVPPPPPVVTIPPILASMPPGIVAGLGAVLGQPPPMPESIPVPGVPFYSPPPFKVTPSYVPPAFFTAPPPPLPPLPAFNSQSSPVSLPLPIQTLAASIQTMAPPPPLQQQQQQQHQQPPPPPKQGLLPLPQPMDATESDEPVFSTQESRGWDFAGRNAPNADRVSSPTAGKAQGSSLLPTPTGNRLAAMQESWNAPVSWNQSSQLASQESHEEMDYEANESHEQGTSASLAAGSSSQNSRDRDQDSVVQWKSQLPSKVPSWNSSETGWGAEANESQDTDWYNYNGADEDKNDRDDSGINETNGNNDDAYDDAFEQNEVQEIHDVDDDTNAENSGIDLYSDLDFGTRDSDHGGRDSYSSGNLISLTSEGHDDAPPGGGGISGALSTAPGSVLGLGSGSGSNYDWMKSIPAIPSPRMRGMSPHHHQFRPQQHHGSPRMSQNFGGGVGGGGGFRPRWQNSPNWRSPVGNRGGWRPRGSPGGFRGGWRGYTN